MEMRQVALGIRARRAAAWCMAAALPLLAAAGSVDHRSYQPPARPGYIYMVVRYADAGDVPGPTAVTVTWGAWRGTASFVPPPPAGADSGVVIRLTHHKADSVPLTVDTNGRIVLGPYQGDAPAQWRHEDYRSEAW